jgi:hypothetical protein
MGRADLIGPGKRHLIPAWQPAGTLRLICCFALAGVARLLPH